MFDFEDELIIENNGVSWLIWIQLLVVFLIFALYCLTVFAFDLSKSNCNITTATVASPSSSQLVPNQVRKPKEKNIPKQNFRIVSNRSRSAQVRVGDGQNIKREITASTSRIITQLGEGIVEGEGSQETQFDLHPCSYFKRARSAFLRCLGLDSSSEDSIDEQQRTESRKFKES